MLDEHSGHSVVIFVSSNKDKKPSLPQNTIVLIKDIKL